MCFYPRCFPCPPHTAIINSFLISPTGQSVSEGNSLFLFCLHSGSLPAAQITWLRDSSVLTSSNRVSITSDVLTHANPPQTTSSLSITSVLPSDSGSYTCRATNSLLPTQQVTSAAAVVTVQGESHMYMCIMYTSVVHSSYLQLLSTKQSLSTQFQL